MFLNTRIGILVFTIVVLGSTLAFASNSFEDLLKEQVETAVTEGQLIFIQIGPKAHEVKIQANQSIEVKDGWVQITWSEIDSQGNTEKKGVWRPVSSVIGLWFEYEENGDNALCLVFEHGF